MSNNTISNYINDIPHGHGLSFKRGISDGLLDEQNHVGNIPNGHNRSYEKGKEFSKVLKDEILKKVKS